MNSSDHQACSDADMNEPIKCKNAGQVNEVTKCQ